MTQIYDQAKNFKLKLKPEVDVSDILVWRIPSDSVGVQNIIVFIMKKHFIKNSGVFL